MPHRYGNPPRNSAKIGDRVTALKIGTYLPNFSYTDDDRDHTSRLKNWIVRSEELGLDSIWVTDHLLRARDMYARTWLEPLTSLTFAAALTERVHLGPGILLLPLRNPVLLAKEIATLQALSKGRFILGAGTGWFGPEFEATGTSKSVRGARTDEVLEVVRQLLAGGAVTFKGQFFDISDVTIEPSPSPTPVWAGGGSQLAHPGSVEKPELAEPVARRIARADGWFTRPTAQPSQIVDDWTQLQPYIVDAGRDPTDIVLGHGQLLYLSDKPDRDSALEEQHRVASDILGHSRSREQLEQSYLFGTIDEVIEECRHRADIGIDHLILHPLTDDPEQIELWGRELIPALKEMEVGPRL